MHLRAFLGAGPRAGLFGYRSELCRSLVGDRGFHSRVGSLFARRALQFHVVMPLESARWGDNRRTPAYGQAEWQVEYDGLMQDYFPQRSAIVSAQRP